MSQAGRTRYFARSATRARSARRGKEKNKAPVRSPLFLLFHQCSTVYQIDGHADWSISTTWWWSLLSGERPKLNQHPVLWKKTSRRRRPWLRSETGKNKIYRSKHEQFRQFPQNVIQNPQTTSDFLISFFLNSTRDRKRWPDRSNTIS